MTTYHRYHAYVLRLWKETPDGAWRVGLKDAETGEVHGFADVASMADFVETLMQAHEQEETIETFKPGEL